MLYVTNFILHLFTPVWDLHTLKTKQENNLNPIDFVGYGVLTKTRNDLKPPGTTRNHLKPPRNYLEPVIL